MRGTKSTERTVSTYRRSKSHTPRIDELSRFSVLSHRARASSDIHHQRTNNQRPARNQRCGFFRPLRDCKCAGLLVISRPRLFRAARKTQYFPTFFPRICSHSQGICLGALHPSRQDRQTNVEILDRELRVISRGK